MHSEVFFLVLVGWFRGLLIFFGGHVLVAWRDAVVVWLVSEGVGLLDAGSLLDDLRELGDHLGVVSDGHGIFNEVGRHQGRQHGQLEHAGRHGEVLRQLASVARLASISKLDASVVALKVV